MSGELVTVHTTNQEWDAELIKQFLEEQGVPVHLAYESVREIYGHFTDGIGGLRLQVPDEFEAEARRLLADYLASREADS